MVCEGLIPMIRIKFRITYDWKIKILLISVLFLSLLAFDWSVTIAEQSGEQIQNGETFIPADAGKRHFYLTNVSYPTNQALNACASGYHMASLWEILDVSNLIYDQDHPDAHTKDDSGYGPPSGWYGWIRTGGASSSSSTTGTGNCLNWSSTASDVYGVAIRLATQWEAAPGDISTWDATSFTCSPVGPVWCVGNFGVVYLPQVAK
jgi:hypothetical protein